MSELMQATHGHHVLSKLQHESTQIPGLSFVLDPSLYAIGISCYYHHATAATTAVAGVAASTYKGGRIRSRMMRSSSSSRSSHVIAESQNKENLTFINPVGVLQ